MPRTRPCGREGCGEKSFRGRPCGAHKPAWWRARRGGVAAVLRQEADAAEEQRQAEIAGRAGGGEWRSVQVQVQVQVTRPRRRREARWPAGAAAGARRAHIIRQHAHVHMCALRAVDLAQGRGAPSSPWQAFVRVRAGACSRRSGTHPLSLLLSCRKGAVAGRRRRREAWTWAQPRRRQVLKRACGVCSRSHACVDGEQAAAAA